MRVNHDGTEIELTRRMEAALIEMLRAEAAMMAELDPEGARHWTWGRARIVDFASSDGVRRVYGGDEDPPDDDLGDFAVVDARYALHGSAAHD